MTFGTHSDDVQVISVNGMLQQEGSDDECEALDVPCHILNLVADYDSKATRKDDKYKRMYDRSSACMIHPMYILPTKQPNLELYAEFQ